MRRLTMRNLLTESKFYRNMKNICSFCLLIVCLAGLSQPAFSQRKKTRIRKAATVSREPRWNIAELSFSISDNPLKISTDTIQLPKEFYGHDFIELFANLEKAVNRLPKDADAEEKYQMLKTKKLLGNLTIDDYFVFNVQRNSGVHGYSKDFSKVFDATTFQLRQEHRIEADRDFFGGCSGGNSGMSSPRGESPEDFIKSVKDETVWKNSYLLLNTLKPIYSRKNYRGKLDDDASIPKECRYRYVVPSPQAQYELAFTKPQPFELAESETVNLSLEDYEYHDRNGVGVIAWESKGEPLSSQNRDGTIPLFVVKIKSPFFKSETLETDDLIEKRKFKMFARTFYVEIEAIWLVGTTGKIIKKIGKTQ